MLTRSAYILIAGVLEMNRSTFGAASTTERDAINGNLDRIIDNFCRELTVDNPRFDDVRFKVAAGYGTYLGEPKKGSLEEKISMSA